MRNMRMKPSSIDTYKSKPNNLHGSVLLCRTSISKKTMYKMVPVATADNKMMTGESEPDTLDSVKMTIKIPRGDMREKIIMRPEAMTRLWVLSSKSMPWVGGQVRVSTESNGDCVHDEWVTITPGESEERVREWERGRNKIKWNNETGKKNRNSNGRYTMRKEEEHHMKSNSGFLDLQEVINMPPRLPWTVKFSLLKNFISKCPVTESKES